MRKIPMVAVIRQSVTRVLNPCNPNVSNFHISSIKFLLLTLVLVAFLPVNSQAQKLLAELPMANGSQTGDRPLAVSATFCMGYYMFPDAGPGFAVGTPPSNNTLGPVIGCGQPAFAPGQSTFFDFDASNSPQFSALVSRLTDSTIEQAALASVNLDSIGDVLLGTSTNGFFEPTELVGSSIDFIRLVVNRFSVSGDFSYNTVETEVVWQIWSGTPYFSGGGQRTEVNDFLQYKNPLDSTTLLPAGSTAFPLSIIYGPTINAGTFTAELNGQPITSLTPIPGATETVLVPVSHGRNVLVISVNGATLKGKTATDKDRLTLIVP